MDIDKNFLYMCEKGHFKEIVETFEREEIIRNTNLVLLISCENDNIEMVKKMLEIGADVNTQSPIFKYYNQPITISCWYRYC